MYRELSADTVVIVTAGPTREWIDPVRYITNASSGKMGVALAQKASERGFKTILVHGPLSVTIPDNTECIPVETTHEMLETLVRVISLAAKSTETILLFMAAAPADYRCCRIAENKIKKSEENLLLELIPNPDILSHISGMRDMVRPCQLVIAGFAAETDNCEENALKKLKKKDLDYICLNDVTKPGAGFNTDTNMMTVYDRGGHLYELELAAKNDIAARLLDITGALKK